MKIFVAGGTGAIGRPLIAELLARGHALVALTRSPEKAQSLVERGIEPAIADGDRFDGARSHSLPLDRVCRFATRLTTLA